MNTGLVRRLERYRQLAPTLIWREIVVRYKRSLVGVGWAFADPVLNTLVYVLVFGVFLGASSSQGGYPIFTLCGVLAWTFLSMTVEQASGVLIEHSMLIRRVRFPHELLVFAVVGSRALTFLAGLLLAVPFAVAGVTGARVSPSALWSVPLAVVLLMLLTAGIALAASAVAVFLADTAFVLRFALRFGFYACPIVYPLSRVPEEWRDVYSLNPLVGLLWFLTEPLVGGLVHPGPVGLAVAVVAPVVSFVLGLFVLARLRYSYVELL